MVGQIEELQIRSATTIELLIDELAAVDISVGSVRPRGIDLELGAPFERPSKDVVMTRGLLRVLLPRKESVPLSGLELTNVRSSKEEGWIGGSGIASGPSQQGQQDDQRKD